MTRHTPCRTSSGLATRWAIDPDTELAHLRTLVVGWERERLALARELAEAVDALRDVRIYRGEWRSTGLESLWEATRSRQEAAVQRAASAKVELEACNVAIESTRKLIAELSAVLDGAATVPEWMDRPEPVTFSDGRTREVRPCRVLGMG